MRCELTREHLWEVLESPMNESLRPHFSEETIVNLLKDPCASFVLNGHVQVCGGVSKYWEGRGQVWTLFSPISKQNFVPVFRAVKAWIHEQRLSTFLRIEVAVPVNMELARRRALMLGFQEDIACAKKYFPNGGDATLLSMVRE